jgi:8-oxo-dGTP pyrophosphatase MutT (NUDIX family)
VATPVEPRQSATVILVRPAELAEGAPSPQPSSRGRGGRSEGEWAPGGGATPYEIFMVRRPAASTFAPDVYVFPGGTLQADDWPPDENAPTDLSAAAAHARLGGSAKAGLAMPEGSLALWINALRETFEEAGVLLARDAHGDWVAFDDPATATRFAVHRAAVASGGTSLWELARREGLTLAPGALRYWAHWITPEAAKHRYDTRFFLALMPPRQEALHCGAQTVPEALACTLETTDGVWIAPDVAVARHAAREFPLVFATYTHLQRLAEFPTLEALWAHTTNKPVVAVLPVLEADVTPPRILIPPEVAECW